MRRGARYVKNGTIRRAWGVGLVGLLLAPASCSRQRGWAGEGAPSPDSAQLEPERTPAGLDATAAVGGEARRWRGAAVRSPAGALKLDFPYHDEELLQPGYADGGRVWVPAQVRGRRGRYPLLVLLHGVRKQSGLRPHRLMSAPLDVTQVVATAIAEGRSGPVLVAAPSQNRRDGKSHSLWRAGSFELADFVAAVERELAAHAPGVGVDRRAVSVLGHSGAGCNLRAGASNSVLGVVERLAAQRQAGIEVPLIGLMDTCFYGAFGARWLRRRLGRSATRVLAMWVYPGQWGPRDYRRIGEFTRALGARSPVPCDASRFASCRSSADDWRVYEARRGALERQLRRDPATRAVRPPHRTLVLWFVDEVLRLLAPAGAAQ